MKASKLSSHSCTKDAVYWKQLRSNKTKRNRALNKAAPKPKNRYVDAAAKITPSTIAKNSNQ